MNYKDIIKDLKAKKYHPVYFLHGDEPYYIDLIVKYIEDNVLTDMEKGFNFTVLYGKEANYMSIVDNARRYPIMAEKQVLIIKEAQAMKDLAKLEKYLDHAAPTTLLVICYKHKKLDKRTKFAQKLKKKAVVFESKKLYDNQVPAWISDYLKGKGFDISLDSAALITEYLGSNLSKIVNELEKLILNVSKTEKITPAHIQEHIGISKDYNVFELTSALGAKNVPKVQRIVQYFIANTKANPFVLIVGALYNYFSKVYIAQAFKNQSDQALAEALKTRAFFVKDYRVAIKNYNRAKTEDVIELLAEYDLKSKGVNRDSTPETELLRELIYKIMH